MSKKFQNSQSRSEGRAGGTVAPGKIPMTPKLGVKLCQIKHKRVPNYDSKAPKPRTVLWPGVKSLLSTALSTLSLF